MNKKRWSVLTVVTMIIIASFIFYQQSQISIWGYNFSKNEMKSVIIVTKENQYVINDREVVLEIADVLSKMEKSSKISAHNFPSELSKGKYNKVLIQTKDASTYGGNVWGFGNKIDSNGYYWMLDDDSLSNVLDQSLKYATVINK